MPRKICLLLLSLLLLTGICRAAKGVTVDGQELKRIGGWPAKSEEHVKAKFHGDVEYVYLATIGDMMEALRQGKIDAIAMSRVFFNALRAEGEKGIAVLGDPIGKTSYAFVFAYSERGDRLREAFNAFLRGLKEDGTLDEMKERWMRGETPPAEKPNLPGENGTLVIATDGSCPPLIYLSDGKLGGYEAELLQRFCEARGYNYRFTVAAFEVNLASVGNGQSDIGINAAEYTPERAENFRFSEVTFSDDCVLVVRADAGAGAGLWETLKTKFDRALLRENRWKDMLFGMGRTMIITVASIVLGTILGFFLCFAHRERNPVLNRALEFVSRFLAGMPVVVLLMVFYYIVFSGLHIDGVLVSILVFSLLFAFSVFGMLKSGAESVPKGQMEAALALGFSERQAFRKFILPPAILTFFPTYQTEIVSLLKSTAIVGYIAVQDLTKVADLIRARTFDAFMPLIVISALYLVLAWLFLQITKRILARLDPRNRTADAILRGVKP
ncbi:MAG: ABC transporter substrate-binding protein/permease [Schwartzia sp.]|nr:ABC transporter substrate-binding protein/permease [Schwartzia sp. (in: firmicutes)]MBR1761612.1 ABC transporter substrate-binding protein/permease [Schwartzia sp. (in: firmicutes)]MBR1886487.1 ABC transporter substrate-binding protein/permease [Schwartzia sp. (in: firmicutes)]